MRPKVKVVNKEPGRIKSYILSLGVTLLIALAYYYFALPAINLQNTKFYGFFLFLSVVYCVVYLIINKSIKVGMGYMDIWRNLKSACAAPVIICVLLIALFIVGGLMSSVFFRSRSYKELLSVTPGDFVSGVEETSFDQIPMLDKASAQRLGDRKLGELSDMVSQFEVSNDYPQMNYRGKPVRVATLLYGDFFKWWNNFRTGLPGYIVTDMVTQNVEVVRLPEGIKYSKSDKFFRNIDRYLRFSYPGYMFEMPHMEIDESGVPYWICPRIVKTIGLFGGTDINGAVLINAVTGETVYYRSDEVPVWVDQIYSAALIIEQYDYYGTYQNGFFNSLFGQKGVTVTTDGYNYIAQNDDVYMYTGITSVGGDESNIGFILSNQRTKETHYYPCAGAEEYSAMSSAEGVVQHLNYISTFPLLLNISKQPTYFMSLKDNAGLVKMYAMVNVQQYNIVATGNTVAECRSEYTKLLVQNSIASDGDGIIDTVSGLIEDIRVAVIDGNSYYYFKLSGKDAYYSISAAENSAVVILDVGDRVTFEFENSAEEVGIYPASLK